MNNSLQTAETYNKQFLRDILLAMLLGVLTVFFCVYVADGLFGIRGLKHREVIGQADWGPVTRSWVERENQTGAVIFWLFLLGLPLLFTRWTKWRYTLFNLLIYPMLWYIVDACVESHHGHLILSGTMGWFSGLDKVINPIFMSIQFLVAHSMVFFAVYCIRKIRQKTKKA
jgi:hypothetical protein